MITCNNDILEKCIICKYLKTVYKYEFTYNICSKDMVIIICNEQLIFNRIKKLYDI